MARTTLVDERCFCGNLLARVSPDGVEILCRRCKRRHWIAWPPRVPDGQQDGQAWTEVRDWLAMVDD